MYRRTHAGNQRQGKRAGRMMCVSHRLPIISMKDDKVDGTFPTEHIPTP
jgi:hypothetical protein